MHVAAMIDRDDRHDAVLIVDLVDHPEVTPTSTVLALQVESERPTDSLRTLRQTAVHELHTRSSDLLREPVDGPQRAH